MRSLRKPSLFCLLASVSFLLLFLPVPVLSQGSVEVPVKRVLDYNKAVYQTATFHNHNSIRIENSQIWINGNLIPANELPQKLRSISTSCVFHASLLGVNEFKFSLFGSDFLVKHGKIVELPAMPAVKLQVTTVPGVLSREDYFGNIRSQHPAIFNSQVMESQLHERVMNLALDYQIADSDHKRRIESEIRLVLEQLFDLNTANELREIRQMEDEISALKEEINFRESNRQQVISNRLRELTTEK